MFANGSQSGMGAVDVIDNPAAAVIARDPDRSRLLAELGEPASAAALGARLGIARQKLNYHLRTLEAHHLVRETETRRWGGLQERLLVASAGAYLVSPVAPGPAGATPERTPERLSARYLLPLAGRVVTEVGAMLRRSRGANTPLATLALDTEIRFRSAAERAAFSDELLTAIATLVARYHDASAPHGREYRLLVTAHPLPQQATGGEP
ncbi:MAG: helix-turn-helix domain-containing protein [Thermomicrobiales bacterium]